MLEKILPIKEITQIFTLNKNLFVQVDDDVKMYGNKNKDDAARLFEILREDILSKNRGNFIFVKDITTHQRKLLYDLLVSKGFNRRELFRHYSY
jgi:histidinol-phosphate/aromatic aminotransferase/cobyric acid decarboxylase-like protein